MSSTPRYGLQEPSTLEWLTAGPLVDSIGPRTHDISKARVWRNEASPYNYRARHPELKRYKVRPLIASQIAAA
jgi:hypothetical protein